MGKCDQLSISNQMFLGSWMVLMFGSARLVHLGLRMAPMNFIPGPIMALEKLLSGMITSPSTKKAALKLYVPGLKNKRT